jgi:ABC-type transport system substrate-binding protein/DNA-binding SARP family transcriptional activator
VDVRLLGPLEVRLGDGPIELGPRKQRAVLAMLALEPGRTVSADRLAEGLWGDRLPPSAAKMVQLYVSHLRRVLDGDGVRIVTRGRGYELQLADGEIDAVRAERLLEESRPREALALWRGEPLADLADEPFAAAEIRRLEDLRLRATELAIDADLAAGRHAELTGELDALVEANPLRERLHAQRMLALYRAGRQSEALAAYRAARTELVEQIGVEPGAELQRLHERILAHDPALDLPVAPQPEPVSASRASRQRRSRALLVGAATLVIAGILAFGIIRVLQPDGLSGIGEDHVGLIDPDGGRITAEYSVGHSPGAVTAGGGSVWVANRLDGTVSRIDRDRQVTTLDVGGAPAALAFGGGSLWVADGDAREVAQVDPRSNKVRQKIPAANAPRSLALAEGALWVVSAAEGDLHRVDLRHLNRVRKIPLGVKASAIAAGAGALWVASEEAGNVTRLDPRSGSIVEAIPVGHAPSALAVGEGAVWVADRTDGTLARVDPDENKVTGSAGVGRDPSAVAVGEGEVWVAGGEDGTVARIDPEGPRVLERLKTGSSPSALAVADGSVWTAAVAPESAHRGGTLRADLPYTGIVPANWLHEQGYFTATWMLAGLAYDGLVAYRRVSGTAGGTLVGALATRPPRPSPDGRTYVFTLRPGIRYSDGTPVRPGDFRASMERHLGAPSYAIFPPYFSGIVGARRCSRAGTRCDLSQGIESDTHARTITVHLTAPDPAFLHKLTMPMAYVVPAGTPAHADDPGFTPPGTGPYRIAAWDVRRGGVLVRNPRFRPTAARPAGFPDRIEIEVTPHGRVETHTAAVERADSDLTWLMDFPLRDHLPDLLARAPAQLHSAPWPGGAWVFLNVRRPPFDDPRVRRALNFALDRAKLVELHGGPQTADLTCQMVTPGFPGHSPYCPYTADPAPGGGWTAPDLERARGLVAASGRAGASVTMHIPPEESKRAGPYFVSLLRDLGFRARLQVSPDFDTYTKEIDRRSSRAQMGMYFWGPDYMSASTLLEPTFGCTARGIPKRHNAAHVCDAQLDAAIDRARAAAAEDAPTAWAAVDRRIVDLAAAIPYASGRSVTFVSKRVGNATFHPLYNTLLDQMWVR